MPRRSSAPRFRRCELLQACQQIENDLGRRRVERWGPRTIDLDLLLYDDLMLDTPDLQLPHPRMAWRRFVLEPAAEIAADMLHPVIGWTVGRLLEHLNSTPWYLALAGPVGIGKTALAVELSQRLGTRLLLEPHDPVRLKAFCYNPSSREWELELEFLRRRVCLLDLENPDWASMDRPTVSSFWSMFWFEQSANVSSVLLPAKLYADYMAVWSKLSSPIVRPRLVALLRAPREVLLGGIRRLGWQGDEELMIERVQQMDESLERQSRVAESPLLRVDVTDRQIALTELAAAVEAMR